MQYEVTVRGYTFSVEGTYDPGDPGNTSGPPERCWPSEPAWFEIESIKQAGDDPTELVGIMADKVTHEEIEAALCDMIAKEISEDTRDHDHDYDYGD